MTDESVFYKIKKSQQIFDIYKKIIIILVFKL